jgi:hypothetical protein
MTVATQHARQIGQMEELLRESIPDDLGMLGDECPAKITAIRGDFISFIRLAESRSNSLHTDLESWRSQVRCGERDFDLQDEAGYKSALSGLVAYARLLNEKYETYRRKGILLLKPNAFGISIDRIKKAEKTLREWESPEWEVDDMRTVKWDKEQTGHLREKLGSRE